MQVAQHDVEFAAQARLLVAVAHREQLLGEGLLSSLEAGHLLFRVAQSSSSRHGGRVRLTGGGGLGLDGASDPRVNAARHVGHGAVANFEEPVGGAAEKRAVVGGDDEGPGPLAQEVLDQANGFQVEVVGGFVEEEDVRALGEGEQQLESPSLTTRELPRLRRRKGPRESEALHQGDVGGRARHAARSRNELLDCGGGIELAVVLFEV